MRKSRTNRLDCQTLTKKMAELQEAIVKYTTNGMQESGLHDDMWVIGNAIYLRDRLNELIDKEKDKEAVEDFMHD